jgi:DNA-binding MarR family transcriptional regulator
VEPPPDPPQRLTLLPSWLLSQVSAHSHRLIVQGLAEVGLRKHHFTVLYALRERGAVSQADLGRRLGIDRSDLHLVLSELERDGLVERIRNEQDKRRNVVDLTAAGVTTLAGLDDRVLAIHDVIFEPLDPAEREAFFGSLARLAEHHRRSPGRVQDDHPEDAEVRADGGPPAAHR